MSTSQIPLVLSYISFGLVLSESKIFKAFISQSETIISHGVMLFLCNIHSKIMNFYEGVSREIYEKESHQNQMNNKPSTHKTNTETSIFIPWEPLVWKWVGLKYP